jgi:hypothetical protein
MPLTSAILRRASERAMNPVFRIFATKKAGAVSQSVASFSSPNLADHVPALF